MAKNQDSKEPAELSPGSSGVDALTKQRSAAGNRSELMSGDFLALPGSREGSFRNCAILRVLCRKMEKGYHPTVFDLMAVFSEISDHL